MDKKTKNVFFDIEMLRRRLIRPYFIELGLTVGQGQPRILKELREHGIMNQKELADACLMDVTTMSRTLDRMEKDGLLKRENNPASRRSWNVLLTDYGSQKADEVIRIFNRIDNVIYNGFSEEEVQTLSVMAGKVEKNLWEAIRFVCRPAGRPRQCGGDGLQPDPAGAELSGPQAGSFTRLRKPVRAAPRNPERAGRHRRAAHRDRDHRNSGGL